MALSLDATTKTAYDAAASADARAQAVIDALSGTVTVGVYNAADQLVGSGTMVAPWATRSGAIVTIGEMTGFAVTQSGTPDPASWYLRFEGGSGRWLRGTFGLTGSGADFTWSLANWTAGQGGNLGAVTATAPGSSSSGNFKPSFGVITSPFDLGSVMAGSTVNVPIATDANGDPLTYQRSGRAADQAPVGFELSVLNGQPRLTIPVGATGNFQVEYWADDGRPGIDSTTQVVAQQSYAKPAQGASITVPDYGTTLTRMTDVAALGLDYIGSNYSQQQAWNRDETLILLYGKEPADSAGGWPYIFDAVAPFTLRARRDVIRVPYGGPDWVVHSGTWKWSPKAGEERSLYVYAEGCSGSAGLVWGAITPHDGPIMVRLDLDGSFAATRTVVASWPTYTGIEKNPSSEEARFDGTNVWVSGCFIQGSNYVAFVHNLGTNTTYTIALGATNPDQVYVTPKCDGIIVATGSGRRLYTLGGSLVKIIEPTQAHSDMVLDASGNQWEVYTEWPNYRRAAIDGPTQSLVDLFPFPSGMGLVGQNDIGQHVSGVHLSSPKNWVVTSNYSIAGGNWVAMRDEIILVDLSSTLAEPSCVRLCQHRAVGSNYNAMPMATVNRTGTKVLFGSNWGGGAKDAYIVDVP